MDLSPRVVVVKVVGETTGEEFAGTFKVKPILTHGEQILVDSLRREFLGVRSNDATGRAFSQANILSEMRVRIVESPSWWSGNDAGAALFDDNVLKVVDEAVRGAEVTFKKELSEKADQAKKDIAKVAAAK